MPLSGCNWLHTRRYLSCWSDLRPLAIQCRPHSTGPLCFRSLKIGRRNLSPPLYWTTQSPRSRRCRVPVRVLVEPFLRQISLMGVTNVDFELLLAVSKHPSLEMDGTGMGLLSFLTNACLTDPVFGRVASIPGVVIINRFHESEIVEKHVGRVVSSALSTAVASASEDPIEAEIGVYRRALGIEMIAKIINLHHQNLNNIVCPMVEECLEVHAAKHPELRALLHFFPKKNLSRKISTTSSRHSS
eukprot:Opistho-2@77021